MLGMPSNPDELAELLGGDEDAAEQDWAADSSLLLELAEEEARAALVLDDVWRFRRKREYLNSPYDCEADPMGFFDDGKKSLYRWGYYGWMGDECAIDVYYDDGWLGPPENEADDDFDAGRPPWDDPAKRQAVLEEARQDRIAEFREDEWSAASASDWNAGRPPRDDPAKRQAALEEARRDRIVRCRVHEWDAYRHYTDLRARE